MCGVCPQKYGGRIVLLIIVYIWQRYSFALGMVDQLLSVKVSYLKRVCCRGIGIQIMSYTRVEYEPITRVMIRVSYKDFAKYVSVFWGFFKKIYS